MDKSLTLFLILGSIVTSTVVSQQLSDHYLMVLGGKGSQLRLVEVVSLDPENPVPQCLENMNDLPSNDEFDRSSGATLPDGTPLLCGSYNEICYRYNAESDSWPVSGYMSIYHQNAGMLKSWLKPLTIS